MLMTSRLLFFYFVKRIESLLHTESMLSLKTWKYVFVKQRLLFWSPKLSLCKYGIKGALNPIFLNLTINREKFWLHRNVLVPFLNLLLLKSCKRTSITFNIHSKVLLESGVIAQF